MSSMSWVGITKLFDESMCLFEYRFVGKLPPGCACGNNQKWQPSVGHKQVHSSGGSFYDKNVGDGRHQSMVNNITQVDTQLYRAGLVRLIDELRVAENETGTKLLCPNRLADTKAQTDYIPDLRDIT